MHDGKLDSCLGADCNVSCCVNGTHEPVVEFESGYRGQHPERISSLGIKIHSGWEVVSYIGCSKDGRCLLDSICDGEDARPLDCRIFPYKRSFMPMPSGHVYIYLQNCPATEPNYSVPEQFTQKVIQMIRKQYLRAYNKAVLVEIVAKPLEC
jgi:hypothetical protein